MNKKANSGLKIICLNRKASFNYFFEDLLDKAGLYSRKGSYDQPLGFMVESTNKGVDERHIQDKLKSRHTNK